MRPLKISSREAILSAAGAALAVNPGASLSEIALRAGVGRATLHRHFATREDLIRELAREALDRTDAAVAGIRERAESAREALQLVLEAVVPLGDRFHFLRSESVPNPEIAKRYQQQLDQLGELVEGLRFEGEIAPDLPDAWVVSTIDTLIWSAWCAVHEGRIAARDAAALTLRTLTRGLAP